MISIFKKKKTTKTLNVKKINNNLQKYFAIDIFTIAPLNNYSSTTKEWDYLYDNFVSMNKENYFGIVAYYDNPGNNKIIFNGWDGLINFYILLKAFYDSLNKQQCEEYESFFRDFFIYTDYSKNKYYLKIQKNTYNDCLKKIINFNNLKINKIDTTLYNNINDSSDPLFICYKYFFEKFHKIKSKEKEKIIAYLIHDESSFITIIPRIQNKTFRTSEINSDYNACVGTNGWNDINTYIDGYQMAIDILLNEIKDKEKHLACYSDIFVYPICFLARHYIELNLKHFISTISLILEIKDINLPIDLNKFLKSTHELSKLYEQLYSFAEISDSRLKDEVLKLKSYISDFAEIDLKGETFRYPYNQNNEHSLDNISHINLLIFDKRFNELQKLTEECGYLISFVVKEYSRKTYINNFGRNIIEAISKDLPDRKFWKDKSFDKIRNDIIQKYSLTSKKNFIRIVDIIKEHPEFSSNIGIINPLTNLTENKFHLYIIIALVGDIEMPTKEVCDFITTSFTNEELLILLTFKEISDSNYYSEDFPNILKDFKTRDFDLPYLIANLFYVGNHKLKLIKKGIKKCGQLYLL